MKLLLAAALCASGAVAFAAPEMEAYVQPAVARRFEVIPHDSFELSFFDDADAHDDDTLAFSVRSSDESLLERHESARNERRRQRRRRQIERKHRRRNEGWKQLAEYASLRVRLPDTKEDFRVQMEVHDDIVATYEHPVRGTVATDHWLNNELLTFQSRNASVEASLHAAREDGDIVIGGATLRFITNEGVERVHLQQLPQLLHSLRRRIDFGQDKELQSARLELHRLLHRTRHLTQQEQRRALVTWRESTQLPETEFPNDLDDFLVDGPELLEERTMQHARLLAFDNSVMNTWGDECWPGAESEGRTLSVGFVVDRTAYSIFGSAASANSAVSQLVTRINEFYTVQPNVKIAIGTVTMAHSSSSLASENWNQASCSSNDYAYFLDEFKAYSEPLLNSNANIQDYQLLSGCSWGGVAGYAAVSALCSGRASGINRYSSFASHWETVAHELGHNFGGSHTFNRGIPQGQAGTIMDYGTVSGVAQFHDVTKVDMCDHLRDSALPKGCMTKMKNGNAVPSRSCKVIVGDPVMNTVGGSDKCITFSSLGTFGCFTGGLTFAEYGDDCPALSGYTSKTGNSDSGRCDLDASKTQAVLYDTCVIPCYGTWSAWGACSSGGSTCTQTRTYTVQQEAFEGGETCDFVNGQQQTQTCSCAGSDVDCEYHWENQGTCSQQCQQQQTLVVDVAPQGSGAACPTQTSRTVSCESGACSIDCEYHWENQGSCSQQCQQQQTLVVDTEPKGSGSACPAQTSRAVECETGACSIDCESHYVDGTCTAECTKQRTLVIDVEPKGMGEECPASSITVTCSGGDCVPDIDCQYTWNNDMAGCSAECEQQQTLNVQTAASGDGEACPSSSTRTVACSGGLCPTVQNIDCEFHYNDVNECSAGCNKTEELAIDVAASGNGTSCPTVLTRVVQCTGGDCEQIVTEPPKETDPVDAAPSLLSSSPVQLVSALLLSVFWMRA